MVPVLVVTLVFVVAALVAVATRSQGGGVEEREAGPPVLDDLHPPVWASPWVAWLVGVIVGLVAHILWGVLGISVAIGGAVALVGTVGVRTWVHQRDARIEGQLADSIDLIVSTLRAGGGLVDALGAATRETPRPLYGVLRHLLDRIRLGEDAEQVLASLEGRVRLESFRLFSLTLGSHWEGGGSLATTLSNVGRTIRDRVDVARRIRSQAVETQVSVAGVLVVTYGLAWLMWTNQPERYETFAGSELGTMFIGASIVLQGVGILWISTMTRIEV